LHFLGDLRADARGDRLAVDDRGAHRLIVWIVATIAPLPPADGGVLRHQLALGSVVGEAHDDHAVGLDARDDSLAEGSVDHVLAEPERDGGLLIARAGCLPRRRATSGAAAGPEPACVAPDRRRAEPGRLHLRLVEKLGRYLV